VKEKGAGGRRAALSFLGEYANPRFQPGEAKTLSDCPVRPCDGGRTG
jgi:hypothetical protein